MEDEIRSDWYSPKRLIIELLGTFSITYFPLLSAVSIFAGESTVLSYAICAGLITATWAWIAFERSGSHFNPAVTLAYMYVKRMPYAAGFIYMLAQIVGSGFAGGIVYFQLAQGGTVSNKALEDFTRSVDDVNYLKRYSFIAEFIGTSILTFAICIFFCLNFISENCFGER